MPDISMCANDRCPKRDRCYRFTAKPVPFYQVYSDFKTEGNDQCRYLLKITAKGEDTNGRKD